ncbi:TPA: hypothetical protein ACGO7I_001861 [Streptococcus suis]
MPDNEGFLYAKVDYSLCVECKNAFLYARLSIK